MSLLDADYILAREACPNCLHNRSKTAGLCAACGAVFVDLLSTKYVTPREIKVLIRRSEYAASRIKAPTPFDWERRRKQLGISMIQLLYVLRCVVCVLTLVFTHVGLRRLSEDASIWYDSSKYGQKFTEVALES